MRKTTVAADAVPSLAIRHTYGSLPFTLDPTNVKDPFSYRVCMPVSVSIELLREFSLPKFYTRFVFHISNASYFPVHCRITRSPVIVNNDVSRLITHVFPYFILVKAKYFPGNFIL